MQKFFLLMMFVLFAFINTTYSQQTVHQGVNTSWGNYVKTGLPGYGVTLLLVRVHGQNAVWSGIFSVNGTNSFTTDIGWNNVRLLSYSNYNSNKDDVKVLIMSNTSPALFGTTEIVVKTGVPFSGVADMFVTTFSGDNPPPLSLVDNGTTAPYAYTMATSEGTLSTWTVNNNVGIGTLNPRTRLDLGDLRLGSISQFPAQGSISEGDWPNYIIGDANSQRLRLGVSNDLNSRAEIDFDNSNRPDGTIAFKTTDGAGPAAVRMFIHGNGNIGIGTNGTLVPNYKLAVNGAIISTKVKVQQDLWADYVFGDNYKMRSLRELEAYIKANKHLPDVPTANEVKEQGLDLGDNQATLLKKIEELTLYIIEQDKKMITQQKEMEQLKKNNAMAEDLRAEWESVKKALAK